MCHQTLLPCKGYSNARLIMNMKNNANDNEMHKSAYEIQKAIKTLFTVQLVSKLHRNMYYSTQLDNTVGYMCVEIHARNEEKRNRSYMLEPVCIVTMNTQLYHFNCTF